MKSYQRLLVNELQQRRAKNARYSLRAFSRVLDMSPALLSSLINGKKSLTQRQAKKIIEKLKLGEDEREDLFHDLVFNIRPQPLTPKEAKILSEDEFKVISDWQHFAILSLGELHNNRADAKWIAQKLDIQLSKAKESFERLLRLELVLVEDSKFRQCSNPLTTTRDLPSEAIRKYHRQNLQLAEEKLENLPVDVRDFSSITMAINPKKIAIAKKMIRDFKQKLSAELESDPSPSEVYTLAIQLFPLTIPKVDLALTEPRLPMKPSPRTETNL